MRWPRIVYRPCELIAAKPLHANPMHSDNNYTSIYAINYSVYLIALGQNECDDVLTFIADNGHNGQVFFLDTNVTAFCIQCVDTDTGTADTDVLWTIDGMWSL